MDGGHLCDLFNHQVLPPILGAVQQLIKLLCGHFPVETAKRAFDSALDDDLLLVRHKANAEASILPKRPQRIIPQQPLHSYPRGAETYAEGRRSATQAKFAIEEAVTLNNHFVDSYFDYRSMNSKLNKELMSRSLQLTALAELQPDDRIARITWDRIQDDLEQADSMVYGMQFCIANITALIKTSFKETENTIAALEACHQLITTLGWN